MVLSVTRLGDLFTFGLLFGPNRIRVRVIGGLLSAKRENIVVSGVAQIVDTFGTFWALFQNSAAFSGHAGGTIPQPDLLEIRSNK